MAVAIGKSVAFAKSQAINKGVAPFIRVSTSFAFEPGFSSLLGVFNFLGSTLPSGTGFSRASSALFPSTGVLWNTASNNIPRLQARDIETEQVLGLMVEPAATNLITANQRDLTSGWTTSGCRTHLLGTGIDGGTCTIMQADLPNASLSRTISGLSVGTAYTFSAFISRIAGFKAVSLLYEGTAREFTGALLGREGMYRAFITFTATATAHTIGFRLAAAGDAIAIDYCQLEAGRWPTSPTLGSRAADVLTISGWTFTWPEAARLCEAVYLQSVSLHDEGAGLRRADVTWYDPILEAPRAHTIGPF